jgi:hypothetical protein
MSTEHNPEPPAGYILDDSVDHLPEGTMVLSRYCEDDDWGFANYAGKDIPPEYHQNWWVAIPIITITPDAGKAEAPAQQPAEAMPETETPETDALLVRLNNQPIRGELAERYAQRSRELASHARSLERRLTAALAELSRLREEIERPNQESSATEDDIRVRLVTDFDKQIRDLRTQLSTERAAREQTEKDVAKLKEELNWQNHRNSGRPTKGGYEFYINEEWTGVAAAALDTDPGWHAALRKRRIDPDDERVRIRRVVEDDAILHSLAESESREHQLWEALERVLKSAYPNPTEHPGMFKAWDMAKKALDNPTSTTVADLRKRAETAERERDAVVKALTELVRSVSDGQDWSGTRTGDALDIAEAAIATTQETK